MVNTGSYKDFEGKKYNTCSISRDMGESAGYDGKCYLDLAPKKEFFRTWRDNRGKIPEDENTRYYIEEYYKQVLSKLDPFKVYKDLEYKILLCYEDSDEFCHRHVVAAWFNLLLGDTIQPVTEISFKDGKSEVIDASARYTDILEDVIKKNEKMCGFTSVRARYLFNKGEQLEEFADKKEAENPDGCYDGLRQIACYYRCDADNEEAEYKAVQYKKLKAGDKK